MLTAVESEDRGDDSRRYSQGRYISTTAHSDTSAADRPRPARQHEGVMSTPGESGALLASAGHAPHPLGSSGIATSVKPKRWRGVSLA
jgi:hypothetical protein